MVAGASRLRKDRAMNPSNLSRRVFLQAGAAGAALAALPGLAAAGPNPRPAPQANQPNQAKEPTRFQIACMTLPYSAFPLQRALTGIRGAGYRYVAWGTTHREEGRNVPVLAADAAPAQARELATRCRDAGLEPLMMFSMIYPEAKNGLEVLRQRLLQAGAAKLPQVLTFGHTRGGNEELWVERFRQLAPVARDQGVMLVVKQHGGETGTGAACARFTRELNDDGVRVNYDAGNVMDYLNIAPVPDLKECADQVRSFCIKDHRNFPKDEDCGPGYGEIDHYKLLHLVAFTGRKMPLCCENISVPLVARPKTPEGIDAEASRAREFLENVIRGLQAPG
jgi:sugar phosphate isomerase/epimerase